MNETEVVQETPVQEAQVVPQKTEATPPAVQKNAAPVMALESGQLVGRTLEEQWRLAQAFVASRMLPARYDTPEKVLTGMQYAFELGLKPLTAMRQIAVIEGTPAIFGDLPLALARASGQLEWISEYLLDKDGKKICAENNNLMADFESAVCETKRKGYADPLRTIFTRADAIKAGLLNKKGTWEKYPKRMMKYRARGENLKDNFGDVINGMAIAEYDFHEAPDQAKLDTQPSAEGVAASLTEKFKDKGKA